LEDAFCCDEILFVFGEDIVNLHIIQKVCQHIALQRVQKIIQKRGRYGKEDIRFALPSMIDGEIITQKPTHDPLEIHVPSVGGSFFDCVFCRRSFEVVGCSCHLGI
jgi:hypothetical protein